MKVNTGINILTRFFCFALLLGVWSCSSDDHKSGPSIYVAGHNDDGIIVWKDGVSSVVFATDSAYTVSSIMFSGNDRYITANYLVGGGFSVNALYMKNNEVHYLHRDGNEIVEASGVAVVGNDVYVSGTSIHGATVWKNGIPSFLPLLGQHQSIAAGIAANGADIYVCGTEYTEGGIANPKLWKDGVSVLTDTTTNAYPEAITISGGDVYMSGISYHHAAYWKNNTITEFGDDETGTGVALAVSGSTISIVCQGSYFSIETNGVSMTLTDIIPTAIAAEGADVYTTGWKQVSGHYASAILKNGVETDIIKDTGANAFAESITVH